MALTLLCLALVVSKQCMSSLIDSFIHSCRMIFKRGRELLPLSRSIKTFATYNRPTENPPPDIFNVPLQI
jgi:hypothetical protein